MQHTKSEGSYVDPVLARITVGEWAQRWLDGQVHVKPSTHERYAGILRKQVLPRWARARLSDLTHAEVQQWVKSLSLTYSPSTVTKVHRVLSLILDSRQRRATRSHVAHGVNLPRPQKPEHRYLTHEQVEDLAIECGYPTNPSKFSSPGTRTNETYRLVVLFLAYTAFALGRWQHFECIASISSVSARSSPSRLPRSRARGSCGARRRRTSGVKSRSGGSSARSSPITSGKGAR